METLSDITYFEVTRSILTVRAKKNKQPSTLLEVTTMRSMSLREQHNTAYD